MAIEQIKIRATVIIGSLSVSTPFIQSFNVRKQRGQVSTFDATLKVSNDEVSGVITGGAVQIYAGQEGAPPIIFSGICRAAKISPCYDDPKYVLLSISGADQMSLLNGKRYTRRCRATKSTWVAITGVTRKGLKAGKFAYTSEPTIKLDDGILNTEDNVTAHTGTAVTDRAAPGRLTSKNENKPAQVTIQILNEGPVEEASE